MNKNKNNIKFIINTLNIFILTICFNNAKAQIFDDTQPHYKVNWSQINTTKFTLIFPNEFKNSAIKLAASLDQALTYSSNRLQFNPKKITIIAQQNHVTQNGFVQLAPRKSELYSTPSGVADNQEWLAGLATHEVQHIVQFDKLTGNIRRPFGELLALAFFGINLPSWFYEGDAVLQESLFSNGGRGRLSSWNMPLRANIQDKKNYNFNKYVHGSFKDIVPDYYTIGYFMNSEMHHKNINFSKDIYEQMHKNLLRPFNFQRALSKTQGAKASEIFDQTIANLAKKWSNIDTNINENIIEISNKYPTNYLLPQVESEYIYSFQTSKERTPRIVKFKKDNPNHIHEVIKTGIQIMPYYHLNKHLITWDEFRKDARFSKQTYNVINIYNTLTKEKKTLTKNSRYYTPILSNNLDKIACIEVNLNNESSIAIIDIENGNKIDSIPMPVGVHIQQPQFNRNSDRIIAIGVNEKGTTLLEVDLETKAVNKIFPWTNLQLERPIYIADNIIFKANIEGKDDLFVYENNQLFRLTNSKFGAFNPYFFGDELVYNSYTTQGYKISHTAFTSLKKNKTNFTQARTLYSKQENVIPTKTITHKQNNYQVKPYNVTKNSINFHSLTLSANDFESFDNYKPGLYWLSNDVLNTTRIRLGYEREVELGKNTFLADIKYQRYYPKFTISYKNSGNFGWAKNPNTNDSLRFDFRNHQISADIELPFSVYRGNKVYSYGFNFGTYYLKRYDLTVKNLKNFTDKIIFPLNYQIYFNKNSMLSAMDLAPRWGQNFNMIFRHMPFENKQNTSWAFRSNFYFPGILTNHSFQTRFNIQKSKGVFQGIYDIPLVGGFGYLPNHLVKNTLLFNYRFPITYPDLSIGQFAYIKRIHAELSADYLNIHKSSASPKSIGAGLNFDFNLFKYNEPLFTFSILGTYINDSQVNKKLSPNFRLSYSY